MTNCYIIKLILLIIFLFVGFIYVILDYAGYMKKLDYNTEFILYLLSVFDIIISTILLYYFYCIKCCNKSQNNEKDILLNV